MQGKPEKLHRVDKQIITLLQEDGRMSFVDIAEKVGVTEGTIRRRFNQLLESGLIRIAGVADPFAVGFETPVFFGLSVDTPRINEVVEKLAELPEVHYAAVSTGEYDVLIRAYFASNQELSDFILNKLGQIEGIEDITSSLLMRIYKRSYTWGVAEDS